MIVQSSFVPSWLPTCRFNAYHSYYKTSNTVVTPFNGSNTKQYNASDSSSLKPEQSNSAPLRTRRYCYCGRRHFLEVAAATSLLSIPPSKASDSESDYMATLHRVRPPSPDWYEEWYAFVENSTMRIYEAEMAVYKSQLFSNLRGKAKKVLEIGIGTGPNLRYYAGDADVEVYGVDPNRKMEKYAQEAAVAAGLPLRNFKFIQAVGEAIPLSDASVDAVVGTLVLCSVKDVDQTLQDARRVLKQGGLYIFVEHVAGEDGTILRFLQSVFDPLQQTLADGCHLTRETGRVIYEAGFSSVDLNIAYLSSASLLNPQIYGIARK